MKRLGLSLAAFLGLTLFLGALAIVPSVAVPVYAALPGSCPAASGVLSAAIDLPVTNPAYPLTVGFTSVANTFTFTVTTPNTDSGQGVIEYCVYPTDGSGVPTGTIPAGTTESTAVVEAGHAWTAGTACSSGCVASVRSGGNPGDIPYDGATTTALTVNWGSSTNFLIVLHILDSTICTQSEGNTCFVIPNGEFKFPPPPPPPTVPEFGAPAVLVTAVALLGVALMVRKLRPSIPTVQAQ